MIRTIRARDVQTGDTICDLGRELCVLEVIAEGRALVLVTERGSVRRFPTSLVFLVARAGEQIPQAVQVPPWVRLLSLGARTRLVQLEQGPILTSPLDELLRDAGLVEIRPDGKRKVSELTRLGWSAASALRSGNDGLGAGIDELPETG